MQTVKWADIHVQRLVRLQNRLYMRVSPLSLIMDRHPEYMFILDWNKEY